MRKRDERNRRYDASEAGRTKRKERKKTPQGRAAQAERKKRYLATPAGKEAQKRWRRNQLMKVKTLVLTHYCGGELRCMCHGCEETDIHFLTLDHINGDGREHRESIKKFGSRMYKWLKAEGLPDLGLQVLCFNCNCGRQANGGICPHLCPDHDKARRTPRCGPSRDSFLGDYI